MAINTRSDINIEGLNLGSIADLFINQVRPDAVPERELNVLRLAMTDGERILSAKYKNKKLYVYGHVYAASRAVYEQRRDSLLGLLQADYAYPIIFEQSGSDRRYYGIYETLQFDYKEGGFCTFVLTFRCTNPFGEDVADTTLISQAALTAAYSVSVESGGNVYALPRVTINLGAFNPTNAPKTITLRNTIVTGSQVMTTQIDITRIYQTGDNMVIDSTLKKVFVNNAEVVYVGRLPFLYKTNQISLSDDATSRTMSFVMNYKKRYL